MYGVNKATNTNVNKTVHQIRIRNPESKAKRKKGINSIICQSLPSFEGRHERHRSFQSSWVGLMSVIYLHIRTYTPLSSPVHRCVKRQKMSKARTGSGDKLHEVVVIVADRAGKLYRRVKSFGPVILFLYRNQINSRNRRLNHGYEGFMSGKYWWYYASKYSP